MISLDLFTAAHLEPVVLIRNSHLTALVGEVVALRALVPLLTDALERPDVGEDWSARDDVWAKALEDVRLVRAGADLMLGISASVDMLEHKGRALREAVARANLKGDDLETWTRLVDGWKSHVRAGIRAAQELKSFENAIGLARADTVGTVPHG